MNFCHLIVPTVIAAWKETLKRIRKKNQKCQIGHIFCRQDAFSVVGTADL